MKVTYFQRNPHTGQYSIETIFNEIREHLPPEVNHRIAVSRYKSKGILKRLYNTVEACFRQGDVNHITGDVHFLALLMNPRKTIITIHDCRSLHRRCNIHREILRLLWLYLPLRRCAKITTISEETKRDIVRLGQCDAGRIAVIPNCISSKFVYTPKQFDEAHPLLLMVGTKANKNLLRVIEALRGIECTLHVIGHLGPDHLRALAESGIRYRNSHSLTLEEMLAVYQQADMLLYPSIFEGFGVPIIEAQAVGRPVLTSNAPPMNEVAGGAACLVDPYSVQSIRRGLLAVKNDAELRRRLIASGLSNAKRFQAATTARLYHAIYREITTGGLHSRAAYL